MGYAAEDMRTLPRDSKKTSGPSSNKTLQALISSEITFDPVFTGGVKIILGQFQAEQERVSSFDFSSLATRARDTIRKSTGWFTRAREELDREYTHLGSNRGRATRRDSLKRTVAAPVLLQRARSDRDVERLSEVAAILAETAEPDELVKALASNDPRTHEFVEALLQAIRWSSAPLIIVEQDRLLSDLRSLAKSSDRDIRDAAYETAVCLSKSKALAFLDQALRQEVDEDLRDQIEEITASIRG